MQEDKLLRSNKDRFLAGICGGLGSFYNIDPILFRLAFVITTLIGGLGLLVYVVLYLVIPEEKSIGKDSYKRQEVFAWVIILVGFIFLSDRFIRFDVWHFIFPLALIALGIFFVKKGVNLYKR